MAGFNFRKLHSEVEQYQVKISNRFAVLENYDVVDVIRRAWESVTDNINASATDSLDYYELEQHKPWLGDECSELLDQI